uniref:Extradiol ring-cleavage dioxygenase class III enzyme subunit B domain-containing protein n=1 Tax=Pinguiococcus pyrenoidosus TaxID=172671 RepID=A0A7R9UC75_9STRA|mmetsp:Transcript_4783/g.19169  ORF Transcript_4783/g.19169 Transcript_4783/m.19169 type:complete len:275 (+) Transcript_4783:279-1103(+)
MHTSQRDINSKSATADWFRKWLEADGALAEAAEAGDRAPYQRPQGIVVVSAHYEEDAPTVIDCGNDLHKLLYDYYGFPPETYELAWPVRNSEAMVHDIEKALAEHGFPLKRNRLRGLDHGVFVPLKLALPQADIPVTQISLLASLDPDAHFQLGQALAPLRDQGYLIVCSGQVTHSLSSFRLEADPEDVDPRFRAFTDWFDTLVTSKDISPEMRREMLLQWELQAPHARLVHPREEHLIPFIVAAGIAGGRPGKKAWDNGFVLGTLSLNAYIWA